MAIAYLSWLISCGAASPAMQDQFALMLLAEIPQPVALPVSVDPAQNDLVDRASDSDIVRLYKVYRRTLQDFLQTSVEYRADALLEACPDALLHEYALILSRMGRHDEVLYIYVYDLHSMTMAEAYCDRIYTRGIQQSTALMASGRGGSMGGPAAGGGPSLGLAALSASMSMSSTLLEDVQVYLSLMKVLIKPPKKPQPDDGRGGEESDDEQNNSTSRMTLSIRPSLFMTSVPRVHLRQVIALAERYYDRMNAAAFMDLLPKTVTVAALERYLKLVLENEGTKKRNLQV